MSKASGINRYVGTMYFSLDRTTIYPPLLISLRLFELSRKSAQPMNFLDQLRRARVVSLQCCYSASDGVHIFVNQLCGFRIFGTHENRDQLRLENRDK